MYVATSSDMWPSLYVGTDKPPFPRLHLLLSWLFMLGGGLIILLLAGCTAVADAEIGAQLIPGVIEQIQLN